MVDALFTFNEGGRAGGGKPFFTCFAGKAANSSTPAHKMQAARKAFAIRSVSIYVLEFIDPMSTHVDQIIYLVSILN